MLTPDGRPPAEARLVAFAALGTMSDALLRFMEPYVWWPPAPRELAELEAWLKLGAAVWNATVRATTSSQLREELRIILEHEWPLRDEEDPAGLVDELAARKLELFLDDYRFVGTVRVFAEGRNATIEAMSVAYLR